MQSFKDTEGREWIVAVNVDAIKRVRTLVDVDLLGAADGSLFRRLAGDPIVLVDVLFALCKPDADTRQVTDEQFGQAMGGDALDDATHALTAALVAFFPRSQRKLLGKIVAMADQIQTKRQALIDDRIANLDPLIEQSLADAATKLDADLKRALESSTGSSGGPPESSASTPDP